MKNKRSSTAKMQIACAIIFITFTYVYLAFYQADVLAVAQPFNCFCDCILFPQLGQKVASSGTFVPQLLQYISYPPLSNNYLNILYQISLNLSIFNIYFLL